MTRRASAAGVVSFTGMFMIESLETRRFFSTTFPFTALGSDGVLTINGLPGDDKIEVLTGTNQLGPESSWTILVRINGRDVVNFHPWNVKQFRVYGFGGDDAISVQARFIDGRVDRSNGPNNYFAIPASVDSGDGNDRVTLGTRGTDPASFDDTPLVNPARDTVYGAGGNDVLRGGAGDDFLYGGRGQDTLDGGLGADYTSGGLGSDTVDYSSRTEAVAVALGLTARPEGVAAWGRNGPIVDDDGSVDGYAPLLVKPLFAAPTRPASPRGGARADYPEFGRIDLPDTSRLAGTGGLENDRVLADVENALGGAGDDVLLGNQKANRLEGGAGNDFLLGGAGFDLLFGGNGDDTLLAADNRDGSPIIVTPGSPQAFGDLLLGGRGRDYGRLDLRDEALDTEALEKLPALWS